MSNKDMSALYRAGNLPTLNQDAYPALGKWWVQIWDLHGDNVLCRVYGDSPESTHERAILVAAALAELEGRG